jgi:hypothetical protein
MRSYLNQILQPSLYRKVKNIFESQKEKGTFGSLLVDKECKVYDDFRTRAHHLIKKPSDNYYLWMSLMQHYGVATRLLDWCEEVNSALFFALEKYFDFSYSGEKCFPCVWILNPYRLWFNAERFYKEKLWEGPKVKVKSDSVIPSLLDFPKKVRSNRKSKYNSLVIPVIAPYTHERIRVQTGTFTLFPERFPFNDRLEINSSENLSLENLPYAKNCLIKIVFPKPWRITEELISIGLKRSMFYPELPNVSIETQQKFLRERKRR